MDIQGAESLALQRAKNLFKKSKGLKMIIEFWPFVLKKSGTDHRDFFDKLKKLGTVKLINEKNGVLINNFDLDFSGDSENKLYNLFIET